MEKIKLKGSYVITHKDVNGNIKSVDKFDNLIVDDFKINVLKVIFTGTGNSVAGSLYLALYKNNYTPQATDLASTIVANAGEFTGYSEANRQAYVVADPSTKTLTNSASGAVFTISAADTLYGIFLTSNSQKSSTSGKLVSVALFTNPKTVAIGETIEVVYNLTID